MDENADPIPLEHLEKVFEHLKSLPESQQAAYLDEVCGENVEMRSQLLLWLASDGRRAGFLDDPTVEAENGSADPMIGTSIGPYKVLEQIGEGGYGVVYLAEQREPMKRRVALKVVKLGMDTKQVMARFEAERQALAMMEHPNIAKVFDAGATETGRPYFVMELVRGVPITDYCRDCRSTVRERLELFAQVCRAVHHAHQKGVIHRDLKPTNTLVTLHDGVPVPKVIDFGIAKAMHVPLTEKTLFTSFQQFVGTPAYTSPEQVEMSGLDVDTRSDIYSLGVLLYELLTGTTPVETETLKRAAYAEIQRTILEAVPPKPSTRLTEIRKRGLPEARGIPRFEVERELDWIVLRALEKDRERRYASANALQEDVRRFLANEPVQAAAPSAFYRMHKFACRHKAAVVIGCTLLVGGIVSGWQAVRATLANRQALSQTLRAETSEREARKNLYFADMNVAQSELVEGNVESAIALLERHRPKPGQEDLRHFEWHYLWRQTHREQFTLLADDDPKDEVKPDALFDVAFAPSGNLLASAARDGRVRVWDLGTRRELVQWRLPQRESGGLAWVEFSPDGRWLAASQQCKRKVAAPEVVLWDVTQRREARRFSVAPALAVIDPRFTADGSTLIAGDDSGAIWFWNVHTGAGESVRGHANQVTTIAIAKDASRMVTCAQHDGAAVWDLDQQEILTTMSTTDHPEWHGFLSGASISPDGETVAVSTRVVTLTSILNADSGETLAELRYDMESHGPRFSPNGKTLAVTEFFGSFHLWNTESWQEITTLHHPSHQLNALSYSQDGRLLASVGDNGKIIMWPGLADPGQGVLEAGAVGAVNRVHYIAETGLLGVTCDNGSLQIWDTVSETLRIATPERVSVRGWDDKSPYQLPFAAFHPNGRQFALSIFKRGGGDDAEVPEVEIWEFGEEAQVSKILPQEANVNLMRYSPDGRLLALGFSDPEASAAGGRLQLLELETLTPAITLPTAGGILSIAFSPDSKLLATMGTDIQIWDLETEEIIATLTEHIQPVGNSSVLEFSPDGRLLASAGYDARVILWDAATWKPVHRLSGHEGRLVSLSFSSDGRRLASCGVFDNRCNLWDVETGQPLARFTGITADFSPDDQTLAIGGFIPFQAPTTTPAEMTSVRLHTSGSPRQ